METCQNEEEEMKDDEFIQMLLERESRSSVPQRETSSYPDWVVKARLEGIQYILRTRERLGFKLQTSYASVAYLDRFLTRRSIDGEKRWAVRLLSMACLSLAAKMEEIRVPALSDFCMDEDDYNFDSTVIRRMELLVLNTLEWKMGLVSPFGFLHFFATQLFSDTSPRSEVSTTILNSMRDFKAMRYKPSVVAAAATLFVLEQGLSREALHHKISPLASTFALQIEEIIGCYFQIQETEHARSKGMIKSPDLSPVQKVNIHIGSSSVTKRKRLVFSEDDEHGDKKTKP